MSPASGDYFKARYGTDHREFNVSIQLMSPASGDNAALDQCAKTLTACKVRFGAAVDLPFGGAPGLNTYS
jgi:phage-related protein